MSDSTSPIPPAPPLPPQPTRQRKWSLAKFQFPSSSKNKTCDASLAVPEGRKPSTSLGFSLTKTKAVREVPTPAWVKARRPSAAAQQGQEKRDEESSTAPADADVNNANETSHERTRRPSASSSLDPMEPAPEDQPALAPAPPSPSSPPSQAPTDPSLPASYAHLQSLPCAPCPSAPSTRPLTRSETRHLALSSSRLPHSSRRQSKAAEKSARKASVAAQREWETAQADLRDWEWHNSVCGCERFAPRTGGGCEFALLRGGAGGGGGEM